MHLERCPFRKQPTNFSDEAEFSTCPSKSKSGDLGWFGPGKMVKVFEDPVKRMSHGGMSPVVKTQFLFNEQRQFAEVHGTQRAMATTAMSAFRFGSSTISLPFVELK